MTALQCRLPDGKQVRIGGEAAARLTCGVLAVESVVVAENPEVWEATEALGSRLNAEFAGRLPSEIPGLEEGRRLYRSFGMDPSRHRPSSEALLRRILKGQQLYRISNLVDTCNLASLSFLLPIGMYDLPKIQGDVTLRTGSAGEQYPGIRKGPVNLAGRLGLFDAEGPFGSPTSDSARTCTDATTGSVLAVVMATSTYSKALMEQHLEQFSGMFADYCQGIEVFHSVLGGDA